MEPRQHGLWWVIDDIIPTNVRLHRIQLADTENCTQSGRQDHTASTHRMRGETGDLGMDPHTDSSDTKDGHETYTQGMAPSSLFQNYGPDKDIRRPCGFGEYGFYVLNQRRTLSVLDCTDFMRRTWRKTSGQTWDAAGGELSGGVLIRPGILEHCTNWMNSKHEESSLVQLSWPTKSVLSHLFLKTLLLVDTGSGNRRDSLEWREW